MKKPSVPGKSPPIKPGKLLTLVVRALDDKKAEELRVLDVSRQSSITDYLVLATGTSEPHLRALRIELERVLAEQQVPVLGVDSSRGSGWTVVDAFELMVHVFTAEKRAKYRLESLWKDASEITLDSCLKNGRG
ncbi:MAG: ribosome silencing factor [Opitutaceae bacterium]|nr:ribosome silencing factor [Opitutaceae bacterium]